MRARTQAGWAHHAAALVALVVGLAVIAPPVHAEERVAALTRMLRSSSDKTRLSAVLALAKLGDRSVQKPLVGALRDPSVRVRAVAATALGRLECDAALPALRALATDDSDDDVRKAASNAALKIARSSHERTADAEARRATTRPPRPRGDEAHADLYLRINSSTDDSPGRPDPTGRRAHAEIVKRVLTEQFRREPSITAVVADAERWGLAARHLDLSVTKLDATPAGGYMEIDAQLRLAISDDHGKMLSFLSGGAKVQVPTAQYDPRWLPSLQKEALENAMRGMVGKLLTHLRDRSR